MNDCLRFVVRSTAVLLFAGVAFLGCSEAPMEPSPLTANPGFQPQGGDTAGLRAATRHTPGPGTTGRTTLHPENQSGVRGRIGFTDNGSTMLTVNGTATGLTPGIPYASLVYDVDSVPGGPEACEPAIFDPTNPGFILPTMFVGLWDVEADGTGTLVAENIIDDSTGQPVYVPLSQLRTISVRDLTVPGPFGPGSGPLAVVACGVVATHGQR